MNIGSKGAQLSHMEYERIRMELAPIIAKEATRIATLYGRASEAPRISRDAADKIAGDFFALAVAHREAGILIEHLAGVISFFPGWEDDVNQAAAAIFKANAMGDDREPETPN